MARLSVVDSGNCEPDPTVHEIAWGNKHARIVLRCGVDVPLQVTDDAGTPVQDVEVHTAAHGTDGKVGFSFVSATSPGSFVVHTMRRGRNLLLVCPGSGDLAQSERMTIDVQDGMAPVTVVLQRTHAVEVSVRTPKGEPIQGAEVQLVRATELPHDAKFEPTDFEYPLSFRYPRPQWFGEDQTDDEGHAQVHVPTSLRSLVLAVDKKGFATLLLRDPQFGSTPLQVTLEASATLRGRVEFGAEPRWLLQLVLRDRDGRELPEFELSRPRPASDGSFEFQGVPAGDYTLELCRRLECDDDNPFEPGGVPIEGSRIEVHLVAGETANVTLRAPAPVYGTVRGRLLTTGKPAACCRVDLVRADTFARRGVFVCGADGSFVADRLLPGRYHLAVHSPQGGAFNRLAILAESFEVGPGAEVRRDFTFTRRRLVLHVHGSGEWSLPPASGLRVGGWTNVWLCQPDLVLDPAPELPVSLNADAAMRSWSTPVTMPTDRAEYEATVVLPLPK